jgi:hypothetical protein
MINNNQENEQVNNQEYCKHVYNEALDFVKENGEEYFEGSIVHRRNESGYNDLMNLENADTIKNDNNGFKMIELLMTVIENIKHDTHARLEELDEDNNMDERRGLEDISESEREEYTGIASQAESILTALRRYCINNNGGKRKRKGTIKKNYKKNNTKRKRTKKQTNRYKKL